MLEGRIEVRICDRLSRTDSRSVASFIHGSNLDAPHGPLQFKPRNQRDVTYPSAAASHPIARRAAVAKEFGGPSKAVQQFLFLTLSDKVQGDSSAKGHQEDQFVTGDAFGRRRAGGAGGGRRLQERAETRVIGVPGVLWIGKELRCGCLEACVQFFRADVDHFNDVREIPRSMFKINAAEGGGETKSQISVLGSPRPSRAIVGAAKVAKVTKADLLCLHASLHNSTV